MVMSIGWNPFFDNAKKTIEPWLLHEFGGDFYDQELRLHVLGYIRPEANFTTLEDPRQTDTQGRGGGEDVFGAGGVRQHAHDLFLVEGLVPN